MNFIEKTCFKRTFAQDIGNNKMGFVIHALYKKVFSPSTETFLSFLQFQYQKPS